MKFELNEHQGSFKEKMRRESLLAASSLGVVGKRCGYAVVVLATGRVERDR